MPQACRRPPPCCPRPADCSSPRSSHCGRCLSATGPPAPPSHLKVEEMMRAHRLLTQCVTVILCVWPAHLDECAHWCFHIYEYKRKGHIFGRQKQLRSNVRATNVTLDYFTDTPWGSPSLRFVYARLSLPCKTKNKQQQPSCLLGFHSPKGGSVCDHVMNISILKFVPQAEHLWGDCQRGRTRLGRFVWSAPMVL